MPSSPSSPSTIAALMREQRYRRQFLQADARLAVKVIILIAVATMVTTRNDFRLFQQGPVLHALLVARVAFTVATGAAVSMLRTVARPHLYDQVFVSWTAVFTALIGFLNVTRIPSGEVQGPVIAGGVIIVVLVFALRGPVWPRMISSTLITLSVVAVVWSPFSGLSASAKVTTTIAFVGLLLAGIFSANAFEEQRGKRFDAERQERKANKQLQQKIVELNKEKQRAETAARARTAFLAAMSHEFRTPMNAILGFSELLLAMRADTKSHEYAQLIRESARGLLGLLNDVLDFAKIDADKLALRSQPFNLHTLTASVVAMMEPMVDARPVKIELESAKEVPPFVVGDELRLRQVLVNLLSNAVKFTDRGLVRLIVTSKHRQDCRHDISFRIEDSGIGMNANVMERLFQPFEQGDQGATRRHQGSGLGLAISKHIVEGMGGNIHVESEPGRGSAFSFTITLAEADPIAMQQAQPINAGRVQLSILVVDDHPINLRIATAMLERMGHQADVANNGPLALEMVAKKNYDVVFMDLHMPDMSGIEVTQKILHSQSKSSMPRLVAMTASVFEEDRQACRQAGMQDFIAKPVELAQLDAVLSRVASKTMNASSSSLAPPQLDTEALDKLWELESVSEPGFVASLIGEFLADVPRRIDNIRAALGAGNVKEVEFQAHTLKSSSKSLGATELSSICARIETTAAAKDLSTLSSWIDSLDAEFHRIEPIMAREMTRSSN